MSKALISIFILYIIYLIMKKPKTTTEKPASKTKAEVKKPSATTATKTAAKKTSPKPSTAKKSKAVSAKPVEVSPEITISERVGLTAGDIWKFLDTNGATSIAKLIRELEEEEKIIQRSIGWLAQERKITLYTAGRVETIALQE